MDAYIIVYYLNLKNINNFVKTDLDVKNRFFSYHISFLLKTKNLKI